MKRHCGALCEVFTCIRQAGLTDKPARYEVGVQEISFLGYLIRSGEKITIAKTVQKISDAPRPTTIRPVRSLFGLSGYYREFVPNYSDVAMPFPI